MWLPYSGDSIVPFQGSRTFWCLSIHTHTRNPCIIHGSTHLFQIVLNWKTFLHRLAGTEARPRRYVAKKGRQDGDLKDERHLALGTAQYGKLNPYKRQTFILITTSTTFAVTVTNFEDGRYSLHRLSRKRRHERPRPFELRGGTPSRLSLLVREQAVLNERRLFFCCGFPYRKFSRVVEEFYEDRLKTRKETHPHKKRTEG